MKVTWVLVFIAVNIVGSPGFIIPDELPSILSVIYSNIPTIKKGTDSRIGWGFRLGDRADFQILTELGPQTNTQPLANQGDNSNKRNTLDTLANTLYAQRQQEKNIVKEKQKAPSTDAEKWLETWSKGMSKEVENDTLPLRPKPGIAVGEIDAKSVIPDDALLEQMEKIKTRLKNTFKITPKSPTNHCCRF